MNFESARHNMIEQQLRPWRVNDPAVIEQLYANRREDVLETVVPLLKQPPARKFVF